MLFHDVIMTSYCCQQYAVSGNHFVFQQDSEPLRQEAPNFLASNLWPPNSPDLCPVDYKIWAVMRHRVYHKQIHSVDELMSAAVLNSRFLTMLLTSGEEDIERVSMLKEVISSTACEQLTMLIFFPYMLHSM